MEGYSLAAENNKTPILQVLQHWLAPGFNILEIGSGSGQHAIYFSQQLPTIRWQPSDRQEVQSLLKSNIASYGSPNLQPPIILDLATLEWPDQAIDVIYSANVLHIVSQPLGKVLITGAGKCLPKGGLLILYGPFRYRNSFTTSSNAEFDLWLKARDPESGIRDFEWVEALAKTEELTLLDDRPMPANNQCLIFQKC